MNSEFESNESTEITQEDAGLIVTVKKIQKHLIFLEKKIDILIEKSNSRPPSGGRSFSGGQSFSGGRPFSKERSFNKNNSFSKPYNPHGHSQRSDRFNQGPRSDKPWRGGPGGKSRNNKRGFRGGQFHQARRTTAIHS